MRGFRGRLGGQGQATGAPTAPPASPSQGVVDPGDGEPTTVVLQRGAQPPGEGAAALVDPTAELVPAATEVLDAQVAGSLVDPGAATQVVARGPVIGPGSRDGTGAGLHDAEGTSRAAPPAAPPTPLVSRRVAAEIGLYAGAALVLVSIGVVAVRGWASWDPAVRWVLTGLMTVALIAAGLFVRLPWRRALGDERRRAVSALLSTGVTVLAAGVGVGLGTDQGAGAQPAGAAGAALAVGVVVAMVVVNLVARTPVSEAGLLACAAFAAWVVVPPGPGTWAFLVGLGVVWAGIGVRWARGRRTALVLGAVLALVASVGMAAGPWAWPTRAVQAGAAVVGLGLFLRGRANHWLALGAGAATALAASVAGDVVGPSLALLVGGLATMVVSWIALRSARRG